MTSNTIRERVLDALTAGPKTPGKLLLYYLNGVRREELGWVLERLVTERLVTERFESPLGGAAGPVYRLAEASVTP